jgi:glycosyltransferase involved in cell wall biosynthesis
MMAAVPPSTVHLGLETPRARSGGLNHYLSDLCTALRALGAPVEAVVIGDRDGDGDDFPFTIATSPGAPIPWRMIRMWSTSLRVGRQAQIIDSHFALSSLLLTIVGPLRRLPLVVHFQGPWADESATVGGSRWACWSKRQIERTVYGRARSFVVLSTAFRRILVERYGVDPWAVNVVPPGVDIDRFRIGQSESARHDLNLPLEAIIVVAVRRLVPRMGLDVLIEAWGEVIEKSSRPLLLVVVGEGPERAPLEATAARLGVTDSVRFLGRVTKELLPTCYQAADVSVVPTTALEGFGLVALESLATGTPVVASDTGGLSEALAPLDESLLVPPGDPASLARRLLDAFDGSRSLPSELVCRSYAERFSWPEIARRHVGIYEEVVAESRRRAEGSFGKNDRKLRVVVVGHSAKLSGGELALLRLVPALRNDVLFHIILAEDGPLVSRLEAAGATVEVLPLADATRELRRDKVGAGTTWVGVVWNIGRYVWKLHGRLRRLHPDLVHTNTLKAALYGGVAARVAGIPCLWHIRDRISPDYLPAGAVGLVQGAARWLPSGIVANSEDTLATLDLAPLVVSGDKSDDGAHVGLSAIVRRRTPPSTVVPSPIYVAKDEAISEAKRDVSGPLRVGILGRLAPWKGQDVFLRAFASAFPDGSERAIVIGSALFGEDGYERSLLALVTELGIEDRVDFLGFREDVDSELAMLDVLVHASISAEPFGQVVLQGMAAGLPVVAAQGGGPSEIVTDGTDGLLYPPGDVEALVGKLQVLAKDIDLRHRLGVLGRRTAERFTPARIAPKLLAVYLDTVKPERRFPASRSRATE